MTPQEKFIAAALNYSEYGTPYPQKKWDAVEAIIAELKKDPEFIARKPRLAKLIEEFAA